jgi:hypothetical protein
MKKSSLLLAISLLLAASVGCADLPKDPTAKAKAAPRGKAKTIQAETEKKAEVTGSYIKRKVNRNGQITDGPDPLYVIDNQTIQQSGAADLRQLLVRQGLNR